MKIDQILNENTEQLDELSWQDVKTGAANTLGAIGKGIGGIASVPQGVARAVKAGYKGGVEAIGGPADDANPQAAPAPAAQGAPAASAQSAPAAQQADTSGIESQIKQKEQELASLKSQLAQARQQPKASAPAASSAQTAPASQSAPQDAAAQEPKKPGLGDKVADALGGAADAWNKGVGMGATGQSVADTSYGKKTTEPDTTSIKDAQGKDHQYKKVGDQWVNMADNKPVDAATAAMLTRHTKQQAAAGAANAEMTKNAQAQQKPAPNYDPKTGKASPAQAKQDAESRVWMIQQGIDPDNPMQEIPQDQIQARVDAEQKKQAGAQAAPAAGQSPEEIRKAKQATAAKAAQGQMAANPAAAKQPAVWKNNRAPAGTPASTSPQAAAATAQQPAAKAGGNYDPKTGQPLTDKAKADVAAQAKFDNSPQAKALQAKWDAEDAAAAGTQQPAVWKNNRAPAGTPASTSPQAAAATAQPANDVQARIAKQLAPTQNFGQQPTGYASVKMNAPTGIPQVGGPQPTTGAKAVPAQPAAPAPTASAQADAGKPGFLQSKIKGSQVPAAQPQMAGTDFSAMLARKTKIRL